MDFIELKPGHEDVVNDLVFNYYGKRLASCSADKKIKVDPRRKLSWAHPEFGQLLASCSEDGTAKIWVEQETLSSQIKWVSKATLSDSKKPLNDVKFANRAMGLRLATASADGHLRIYEARSPFDPATWTLDVEYFVEGSGSAGTSSPETPPNKQKTPGDRGITCIAWNDCPFEPDKIAVGSSTKGAIVYSISTDNKIKEECVLGDRLVDITDIAWA
eukprot:gene30884-37321_t